MMRTNRKTKGKFRVKIAGLHQTEITLLRRDLSNIFFGRPLENSELVKRYTVEVPLSRVESIPIEDYLEDDREYIDDMVTLYQETPEELPPVILERANGKFKIVDGLHRITALRLIKKKTVPALVIEEPEILRQYLQSQDMPRVF